jgi:toxin HigB-1
VGPAQITPSSSVLTAMSGISTEDLWPIVRRKLDQIDAVTKLDDLRVPPGNRLHALAGDLKGQHAVRVDDQYRIVFRFEGSDAFDVRCTDYH